MQLDIEVLLGLGCFKQQHILRDVLNKKYRRREINLGFWLAWSLDTNFDQSSFLLL